jgi:hypothetical protein
MRHLDKRGTLHIAKIELIFNGPGTVTEADVFADHSNIDA